MALQLDQQQTNHNTFWWVDSTNWLAQTFKAGLSGPLKKIVLFCSKGSPNENFIVEIQGVSGGYPDGNTLASEEIPKENLPLVSQEFEITFSVPTVVTSGQNYSIVIHEKAGGGTGNHYKINTEYATDYYTDGKEASSANAGSSWIDRQKDIYFKTYVGVPEFEEITSDAYVISYGVQQSVDSLAFINNDITSDAHISVVLSETINSDANIKGTVQQEITSDAEIYPSGRKYSLISSDASIKGIVEEIINSDTHIKATSAPIILSNAHIYVFGIPTITSDAYIVKSPSETITSDSYIAFHKDFYSKVRAQVDTQKDFNLQLKVNQPTPTDPTGLSAVDPENGESLILNWTDTGNYGYNIYKDVASTWVKQNDTLVKTNSYVAGDLVTDVTYTFQVRGVNGIGEESSGVNTSGKPTYNIERYTNPSFKIYIGGTWREDAVLERVDLVYGPSFSTVSFYIPKNPNTGGLPEANRQEVKVEINDRLEFTGLLIKRSKIYDAQRLRISYTAIDKLWEKTLQPIGVDVVRPPEWPEELWNPVEVADLTELEFMETALKYKGNYKIHTDAYGNISYYELGKPISRRKLEIGKHILRESDSRDLTNPSKVITVYSEKKSITKAIPWKPKYWYDIFKPQNIMDISADEISDVQIFAFINEKPEVVEYLDIEVLPGHITHEKWLDGGSEGRFPVKVYRTYGGKWVSVSSKVEYSEDGNKATITVLPLPQYWYFRMESGEAVFKTAEDEEKLYVNIWNKPLQKFARMKVVYTYRGNRLSKVSGSGIASRTYHESIVPFEITVPANIPYQYVSQDNITEVENYLQARAESESARHLEDQDRATMTILGDETFELRTQINGLEALKVTHDFTTSGFLTHIDLTTKTDYAAVVVLRRKEMLERKNTENVNTGWISTISYDMEKVKAIVGEQKHDPGVDPIAGIAHFSD